MGFVIDQIADLKPYLLHDLSAGSPFESLTDFHEACHQCPVTIGTAGVAGQQDLVLFGIHDGDNDGRRDLRIFNLSALRTDAGTLCGAGNCGMPTAAAEFPVQTETVDLGGSDPGECQIFRFKITEYTGRIEVIFREHESTGVLCGLAEECSVIDGKEIFTIQKETFQGLLYTKQFMNLLEGRKIYLRMLHNTFIRGRTRNSSVVSCMGGQKYFFSIK